MVVHGAFDAEERIYGPVVAGDDGRHAGVGQTLRREVLVLVEENAVAPRRGLPVLVRKLKNTSLPPITWTKIQRFLYKTVKRSATLLLRWQLIVPGQSVTKIKRGKGSRSYGHSNCQVLPSTAAAAVSNSVSTL